jgi:hypothetical protein
MARLILTLAITALVSSIPQSAAAQIERTRTSRPVLERNPRLGRAEPASLAVTVGYGTVEFDINQPFAHARATQVPVTVKFNGRATVASLQFGAFSLPLGTHEGSFEQTVNGVDIRSIMNQEAATILERCKAVLDYNKVESAPYAYDAKLAFTVNGPDGAVVASTTLPYQLGLTCKRLPPLTVKVGYGTVEYDINQPFAHAKATQVPVTVKFNGPASVASLQFGSLSLPLGSHQGSFEQTVSGVDIRQIMNQEAPTILERCTAVLDHNKVESAPYAYDAKLAFTVNGPDGAVVASTTVPYQLGLTCKRVPPLTVRVGYGTVEFDINQPFAQAKATQVPVTVKFNGPASVASLQFGSLSLPLGTHQGSFEQTVNGVDIRQIMNQEAATILERCRAVLDYNKVASAPYAYDAKIAFTVNAPTGAVVASTIVPYQLGLTCKR